MSKVHNDENFSQKLIQREKTSDTDAHLRKKNRKKKLQNSFCAVQRFLAGGGVVSYIHKGFEWVC